MKKVIQVTEVENEGLLSLLGKKVEVYALNYIYAGTLTGVNETCILLEDAYIVYETGAHDDDSYKDAQKLPKLRYIQTGAIESFSETTKI